MDQSLASAQPSGVQRESALQVCLISVAGELLAVDLRHVQEVFVVETITPVPGMPPALVGVTNLRGVVMPLVDLRLVVGLPVTGPPPCVAVVIRHGAQVAGVLVDTVPELRTARKEDLLPVPSREGRGPQAFLSALLKMDGQMGGVVEVPTLLASVDKRDVD
ncbi:chemotaxis protein CheW [Nitrospira sp. Kam-Ns4a]